MRNRLPAPEPVVDRFWGRGPVFARVLGQGSSFARVHDGPPVSPLEVNPRLASPQPGDAGQGGAPLHPRGLRHVGGLQRAAGPGAGHHHHDRAGAGPGGGGGHPAPGGPPRQAVEAPAR